MSFSSRRSYRRSYHGSSDGFFSSIVSFFATFGCWLGILAANLGFGGWATNYLLYVFTGKIIPWGYAIIIGLFAGELAIPVAVVVAILRKFGIV